MYIGERNTGSTMEIQPVKNIHITLQGREALHEQVRSSWSMQE